MALSYRKITKDNIQGKMKDINAVFEYGFNHLKTFYKLYDESAVRPTSIFNRLKKSEVIKREKEEILKNAGKCIDPVLNYIDVKLSNNWKGFCERLEADKKSGFTTYTGSFEVLCNIMLQYRNIWRTIASLSDRPVCSDKMKAFASKMKSFKDDIYDYDKNFHIVVAHKDMKIPSDDIKTFTEAMLLIANNPMFSKGLIPPLGNNTSANASASARPASASAAASASKRGGARRRRTQRKRKAMRHGRSRRA